MTEFGPPTVVVPVFGRTELTADCLDSLLKSKSNFRLIVVDNGSGERAIKNLMNFRSSMDMLILLNKNFGKPYAWNLGFYSAEAECKYRHLKPSEFFCFIDNDISVTEGWLETMTSAYKAILNNGSKVGIVSGFESRGAKIVSKLLCHIVRFNQSMIDDSSNILLPTEERVQTISVQEVRYPGGCNFLIHRDILHNEGVFNTNRLIRAVDTEYAKFLTIKGYKHYVVPGLVRHMGEEQRTWTLGVDNDVELFD